MDESIAVLDACVLVPAALCDTLLRCAESPALYRPCWSVDILEEVNRTLRQKIGLTEAQADRRLEQMQKAFPEALVEEYEPLIESMKNDRKDRHVLAAAVHSGADVIVTFNRKHFDALSVAPFEIEVLSPDEFLIRQFRLNPRPLATKLAEQAAGIGRDPSRILDSLRPMTPQFVSLVRSGL